MDYPGLRHEDFLTSLNSLSSSFSKVISWRVWLVSLSVFGLLYGWKWSTFDPETTVKNQVRVFDV